MTSLPNAASRPKNCLVRKTDMAQKKLRVTLVRSMHGRARNHMACVRGLGLKRMHQTVEIEDTPQNRGMINKVSYLLKREDT